MKKSNLIFQCLMLFFTSFVFGQGCSDAGFCTISSFKPNSNDSIISYKNQLKTGAFKSSAIC